MTVVLVILIVVAVAWGGAASGLAWSLLQRLRTAENELRARPVIEKLLPPAPAPVIQARPVFPPEPEPLPDLAAPRALPNVSDSEPDSTVDGARLGRLVVRAAATRGELNRLDGLGRRQAVAVTLLDKFEPPVLLSTVAAGLPSRKHSQLGAVQACRTLQGRLGDRGTALAIDAAWRDAEARSASAGDELRRLLRDVAAEVGKSLTVMAKGRNLEPEEVSTCLTFLLSRLGDTPRRHHLVAGLGGGALLQMSGEGKWSTEYEEAPLPLAGLPESADLLSCRTLESGPGDVLVLCSGTTASFLQRDKDKSGPALDWRAAPPDMVRFFWSLNQADPAREDHAAVALWELTPPVTS